jgi:membrane associated rhomboid family serine protease
MLRPAIDDSQIPPAPKKLIEPWQTVTRWLLVINVAVFVLDWIVIRTGAALSLNGRPVTQPMHLLEFYGHFSFYFGIMKLQLWRLLTYQFCHGSIEHIVLNMMALMLAGPIVEERLGRLRYLGFYLLCGAAGPVALIVLSQLNVTHMNLFTPLVGASASIYGLLVAAARIAPREMVMLAIPPIDVELRKLVWVLIGLSVAAVLWQWQNAGGHAAHLGGAVMGWLLMRRVHADQDLPKTAVILRH